MNIESAPTTDLSVDLGGGLRGPSRVEFTWQPDTTPHVVTGVIEFTQDAYHITSLTISGAPIAGRNLRSLSFAGVVKAAVLPRLVTSDKRTPGVLSLETLQIDPAVAKDGPTRAALKAAATLYRVGFALGENPAEFVAAELGLTKANAARWLSRCRDRGLLPETTQGRAKA